MEAQEKKGGERWPDWLQEGGTYLVEITFEI